jgi:hypothetical protein
MQEEENQRNVAGWLATPAGRLFGPQKRWQVQAQSEDSSGAQVKEITAGGAITEACGGHGHRPPLLLMIKANFRPKAKWFLRIGQRSKAEFS